MSDSVWVAVVGAVATGVVAVLVAWLREVGTSARRYRQWERLEICVRLRRELADDHVASVVVEAEFARLVAALDASHRRLPLWQSAVKYVAGLLVVSIPAAAFFLVLFPESRTRPWMLAAVLVPAVVIYAIESQPLFLQPLVSRWAPGRPKKTRATRASKPEPAVK